MGSRRMKYRFLCVLSLLLITLPGTVMADSPAPPRDYARITGDESYIFVMLAPDERPRFAELDPALRGKYPGSGLYPNDGSVIPLWTVDWYAFDVEVSSDGEHLARWGPWPGIQDYDELAVAFHENGQEIKSYSVEDLVADPGSLPESVSHYMWREDHSFDDEADHLSVETLNGERYAFDIESGELISGSLPDWADRVPLAGIAAPVLFVLLGSTLFVYVRRKRRQAR